MQALADRRLALIARSDLDRAALGAELSGIQRKVAFLESGIAFAQRVQRHRVFLGLATVWSVVAPVAARTWIGRLSWGLPLAIEGLRAAKSFAGARRARKLEP
jgi:hypothetical protein